MTAQDNPYYKLDPRLQRWIAKQGWRDLNLLQKNAIGPVLEHRRDLIISAATAGGKTEAAFLPALTYVAGRKIVGESVRILYISPLKALINDQYRRLEEIGGELDMTITPWHGDISSSRKQKLFKHPKGVILMTPESMESMLMNHLTFVKDGLKELDYFIIDEFHAFIGTERGEQLQSLISRVEHAVGKRIVILALSATFSQFDEVAKCVRPHNPSQVLCVTGDDLSSHTLSLKIHAYDLTMDDLKEERKHSEEAAHRDDRKLTLAEYERYYPGSFNISTDIYRQMRGKVNLVFADSRPAIETMANILREISEKNHVPNEFFPHHGSLAKELRQDLEKRLIDGLLPTTAVCTSTLELGIDIAEVNTVGQINAPWSVASLRQRLGRSGRRDGRAVLRIYSTSVEDSPDPIFALCEDLVAGIASVELLRKRWYEPPQNRLGISTLIQQTLSMIASVPDVTAKILYTQLCAEGAFSNVPVKLYLDILRSLGRRDYIVQLGDGTLTLGLEGEKRVSQYDFYTAFTTLPEFRVLYNTQLIGVTPFVGAATRRRNFLFAGKAWEIEDIDYARRVITVKRYDEKTDPLPGPAAERNVHEKIRKTMLEIYKSEDVPPYLNETAREQLQRARQNFYSYGLDKHSLVQAASGIVLFPWSSNNVLRTLKLLFDGENLKSDIQGCHLVISYCSPSSLGIAAASILSKSDAITPHTLLKDCSVDLEKYMLCVDQDIREINYFANQCDLKGALSFIKEMIKDCK